jgi:diaminobutyrate-2-oxoglutarate transaminase
LNVIDRMESQVRSYCRNFPVTFARAAGSHLYDTAGKRYIDFFCGAGALNYGHNHPAMKAALLDHVASDGVIHSLDMVTVAKERFLERFDSVILRPRGLDYKVQFVGPTGTDGVEAALKLARLATKRQGIIAFTNAYHGHTAGSLSVTANPFYRSEYFGQRLGVSFLPYDGFLGPEVDTMQYARALLTRAGSGFDTPAAFIVETIQAEGGVNVARTRWLQKLQRLCRDCQSLLIVDDIQVGCGRSGDFFSFEKAGLQPDIVVISKAISGFGLPMTLVLLKPEIDVWQPGQHTGTFRGNNLAFVTATEALRCWETNDLTRSVERKGAHLAQRLAAIRDRHPELSAQTRGRGLIHGLEIADARVSEAVARTAFERGLIIERCGIEQNVLKFLPALVIEDPILDQGIDIIESCIADVSEVNVRARQEAVSLDPAGT